jgi:PEGA domain
MEAKGGDETMKALLSACILAMIGLASVAGVARPASIAAPAQEGGMGFLDVSSEPTGARILIDDADLGQMTPQHHLPVRAGHHRLTLVAGDGAHKLTVGFTVEAGLTKKLTLYLAR